MAENRLTIDRTSHFNNYKNKGLDLEALRRRRVETSVEIRKQKKEETLLKKRNVDTSDDGTTDHAQEEEQCNVTISEVVSGLQSSDYDYKLQAATAVRKLLSLGKDPPIDKVINAGLVDMLVSCLRNDDDKPSLQFEAAWALTNIAAGTSEHTWTLIRADALPHLIRLLKSQDLRLVEQCVWALGNISGDGAELRDIVIDSGILEPLLHLVNVELSPDFLCNVTWAISNLCRHKNPLPRREVIRACLPALRTLIQCCHHNVLSEACWAFCYITEGSNDLVQDVVDTPGAVARLVELLGSSDAAIITSTVRTIGNIVTGDESQTQYVLDRGVLKMLPVLLHHSKSHIVKEVCWMLSNITAGSTNQIQSVINHNLLPHLIQIMAMGDFNCQKEAAWAVANLLIGGTTKQVEAALNHGVIKPFCDLLTCHDGRLIACLLDSIIRILVIAEAGGQGESFCLLLEEIGGVDKIEQLQYHENSDIYKKAYDIVDQFFSGTEPDCSVEGREYCFNVGNVDGTQHFMF